MPNERILFITERFPPDLGGVARSAQRICNTLRTLGLKVDVLAWSRHVPSGRMILDSDVSPEPTKQESADGFLQIGLDDEDRGGHLFRVGMYRQWDMTMSMTSNIVDWLHSKFSYSAIWGHYVFPAGFFATWYAQLNNLRSVVSARGNDIDREIFPPGDFARLTWTLQRANVVSAVSKELARKITVACGRDDIFLLHNCVDTDFFVPASPDMQLREQLGIARDEIVLGFSGQLREKKGMQFLLEALTIVRQKMPACLLVVGDVRAAQRAALDIYQAEHPDDAERLIITGHMTELAHVRDHLNLFDLYLQPSLFEGLPNALLEAMSCGRVCIASDAGGITEVIEHGENGFILPRAHLHHLATAIFEAFEAHGNLKEKIALQARATMQSQFSLARELAELRLLAEQFLGDRTTSR